MLVRKTIILIIIQIVYSVFGVDTFCQSKRQLYNSSKQAWEIGDFNEAKSYLHKMLLMKDSLTERNKVAIYNRFGIINKDLGKYNIALDYYKKAEEICLKNFGEDYSLLSSIYNNLAIIYILKEDYEKALQLFNVALSKLEESSLSEAKRMEESAKLFLNIGNAKIGIDEYQGAIEFLEKSRQLKSKYSFGGLENVYQTLAWAYKRIGNNQKAKIYYNKSLNEWKRPQNIENIHKGAKVYIDYALLLIEMGEEEKALAFLDIGNKIYLKNFGRRHPYTAKSFSTIGDYYFKSGNLLKSLEFYQKSIISNTKQFINIDIFSLPSLKDIIADIQFLQSLKRKSEALYKYSQEFTDKNKQTKILNACINSVELSLQHINIIRRGYLTKSSKLNITKDEKACYFQAIEASLELFEITNDEKFKKQAYSYAQKSKASLLREEILQNKAFAAILPDSVRLNKSDIESNIHSYKKLIFDENQRKKPNRDKLNKWSHNLFKLNNEYGDLIVDLKNKYPGYKQLTSKTKIVSLEGLQAKPDLFQVCSTVAWFKYIAAAVTWA